MSYQVLESYHQESWRNSFIFIRIHLIQIQLSNMIFLPHLFFQSLFIM